MNIKNIATELERLTPPYPYIGFDTPTIESLKYDEESKKLAKYNLEFLQNQKRVLFVVDLSGSAVNEKGYLETVSNILKCVERWYLESGTNNEGLIMTGEGTLAEPVLFKELPFFINAPMNGGGIELSGMLTTIRSYDISCLVVLSDDSYEWPKFMFSGRRLNYLTVNYLFGDYGELPPTIDIVHKINMDSYEFNIKEEE